MTGPEAAALPAQAILLALSQTPDAVVIVDREGQVRYWNSGAERVFGYRPTEILGSTLEAIIPDRLRRRHADGFAAAVARGSSRYGDDDLLAVPALHADGRTISIEFSVALLRGGDGSVDHVVAIIRDVTARRVRDRELRLRIGALADPGPAT